MVRARRTDTIYRVLFEYHLALPALDTILLSLDAILLSLDTILLSLDTIDRVPTALPLHESHPETETPLLFYTTL